MRRVQPSRRPLDRIRTTADETLNAEHVILAGGAWTPELTRQLSLRIPMQGGKGYSLTLREPAELPRLCSLLKEARVAVTPMGNKLRVGGTMEICGTDLSINRTRLQGIIEGFCEFFPAFSSDDFTGIEPWSAYAPARPMGSLHRPIPGTQNATRRHRPQYARPQPRPRHRRTGCGSTRRPTVYCLRRPALGSAAVCVKGLENWRPAHAWSRMKTWIRIYLSAAVLLGTLSVWADGFAVEKLRPG